MSVLEIENKIFNTEDKDFYRIIANSTLKTIEIMGSEFMLEDIEKLSIWIDENLNNIKEPVTIRSSCVFEHDYYKIDNYPYRINNIWKNKMHSNNQSYDQLPLAKALQKLNATDFVQENSKIYSDVKTDFNNGKVLISGRMYSWENYDAFAPLIAWVDNYINVGKTNLEIYLQLGYIAKMAMAMLLDFLRLMISYHIELKIYWYCENEDELEKIEDYYELVNGLEKRVILLSNFLN